MINNETSNILYEVSTNKNIEEVANDLKESLMEVSFGVLAEINLGDKIRAKGIEYTEKLIAFEVCNPVYADSVMKTSDLVKYLLPCKITLSTDSGKTIIGTVDFSGFEGLLNDEAKDIALEVISKLKIAIDKASK